ncbi:MAG: DUF4386 domain-containing protein [Anaeromyxobacteraceae bacterium]
MPPTATSSRHPGPPLFALALVHASLLAASLLVTAIATGSSFPSPDADPARALDTFASHGAALRWTAFLQLGAAVPLGLLAASAASRLRFLGVRAAGATIALFGGIAASVFLALSALLQWALTFPEVASSQGTARALHLLAFAAGGPAHVVGLGLLVAGVAVTAGLHGLAPRGVMFAGILIAVVAEVSSLTLVAPPAAALLPVARFPAIAWLAVAAALLPTRRREAAGASRDPGGAPVARWRCRAEAAR